MTRLLVLSALLVLLAGCPKIAQPKPECLPSDGGTVLQTPCADVVEGGPCCFGAKPGSCRAHECVVTP